MRRAAALVGVVAPAVVLVVALAEGWWQHSERVPLPARPIAVSASLSSRTLGFGDPLTARLDVLADPAAVEVGSIRVTPRFAPYRVVTTSVTARRGAGVLLAYRFSLQCLEPACIPQAGQVEKTFLTTAVSFQTAGGRPGIKPVSWPSFRLSSRVGDADRAAPAQRLRYVAAVPPPSYGIDPGTLRALLTALAAVLVLAAATLGWLALGRRGPVARAGPPLSPLERALAAVRASTANGHVAARRKALGWLGRELGAVERADLARGAARLAWSADEPTPESAGAFADGVEEEKT